MVATRHGEDLDLVISQVLQLKWLVYCALPKHLVGCGWSDPALAAFMYSARCDLRDSRARVEHAQPAPAFALAG